MGQRRLSSGCGGRHRVPGYTANPPPRLLDLSRQVGKVRIRCRVVAGKTYQLYRSDSLSNKTAWTPAPKPLGIGTATGSILELQDSFEAGKPFRFYQVKELP